MKKVFIDGSAGTTGLRINERLSTRNDIELLIIPDKFRKDPEARKEYLNKADISFLCLPDAAAIEAVSFIDQSNTAVIDTSTAHRVNSDWTYGFPELTGLRDKIKNSKRIANPGCHASGFIALVAPLVETGIISNEENLDCFSLTGYSGGGKKMIENYESENSPDYLLAPGMYGLSQNHKHLPEMSVITGLKNVPVFCPVVSSYYSGMQVTVPIHNKNKKIIEEIYADYYKSGLVKFVQENTDVSTLYAGDLSGKDIMEITVTGNDDRILLVSRFDNLGKGASGAAIQNMNILLGLDESKGLNV